MTCIKVHLDCLAAYVKIVIMTIDGSDSLVPVERKNHNSSAGSLDCDQSCGDEKAWIPW